jgi:hypothetical protein
VIPSRATANGFGTIKPVTIREVELPVFQPVDYCQKNHNVERVLRLKTTRRESKCLLAPGALNMFTLMSVAFDAGLEGEKGSATVSQFSAFRWNAENISPQTTVHRKPYVPPQIKSLTLNQARVALSATRLPGDTEAEKLLGIIRQLETEEEEDYQDNLSPAGN